MNDVYRGERHIRKVDVSLRLSANQSIPLREADAAYPDPALLLLAKLIPIPYARSPGHDVLWQVYIFETITRRSALRSRLCRTANSRFGDLPAVVPLATYNENRFRL